MAECEFISGLRVALLGRGEVRLPDLDLLRGGRQVVRRMLARWVRGDLRGWKVRVGAG